MTGSQTEQTKGPLLVGLKVSKDSLYLDLLHVGQ